MSTRKKRPTTSLLTDEAYDALIAEVRRPKTDKEKRFIKLGWLLMEHKFRYYRLDSPIVEDHEYDKLEREYDNLAKELGLPPTAVDMVGFDQNRPSGALVADKVQDYNRPKEPK